ncbi:hypothetical protein, partial [Bradyrhizobium sp.]|uniref:hypothetical protein n=1 Tax=Bradyrhizobium sp. TaxID=376 RepID=UPI003C482073
NDNREKRRSPRLDATSKTDLKQCADKHLGTPFRTRGNPLYLAVHAWSSPALATLLPELWQPTKTRNQV